MIITTQVVTEDWESEAYYEISTRPTSISTLKRDKGSRSRWILTPINANHAPIKVRFLHLIRFNNSFESFTFSRKERNYYLSIIFLMNDALIFSNRNLSVKEGTANRKIGRKLVYGEKRDSVSFDPRYLSTSIRETISYFDKYANHTPSTLMIILFLSLPCFVRYFIKTILRHSI